ncbi:hypothetical protein C4553_02800 [Candidatus Parcubacteria bacterium]|nr:MAG: hypothetical protein C4553_02800 [Candidatus Parcubacteria bacterium]
MDSKKLFTTSFRNALATALYIVLIALFFSNVETIFSEPKDNFLAPTFMLLLFVISAAVTGFLVIGKPAMMYVNGEKTEAVKLFLYTIGWLAIMALIVIVSITIL